MRTEASPPRWMLNELRRHIGGRRWHDVDEDEIRQFCRSRTDTDLLAVHNFGNTALALVRHWSGPPEEIVDNWVGEAGPDDQSSVEELSISVPAAPGRPRMLRYLWRLRALREAAGLDVRQLASLAGLPVGTVKQADRLRQRASPTTIDKLAAALGVEPGMLVGKPGQGSDA